MADNSDTEAADEEPQRRRRGPRLRGGRRAQRSHAAVAKHIAAGTFDPARAGASGTFSAARAKTQEAANTIILSRWAAGEINPVPNLPFGPKAAQPGGEVEQPGDVQVAKARSVHLSGNSTPSEVLEVSWITAPPSSSSASAAATPSPPPPKAGQAASSTSASSSSAFPAAKPTAPSAPLYLDSSSQPGPRPPVQPLRATRKRAFSSDSHKAQRHRRHHRLSKRSRRRETSSEPESVYPKADDWEEFDLRSPSPEPEEQESEAEEAEEEAGSHSAAEEAEEEAKSPSAAEEEARSPSAGSHHSNPPEPEEVPSSPAPASAGSAAPRPEEDEFHSAEEEPQLESRRAASSGSTGGTPEASGATPEKRSSQQQATSNQPRAGEVRPVIACDFHGPLSSRDHDSPSDGLVRAIFDLIRVGYVFSVLSFIGTQGHKSHERRAHARNFVRTLNRLLRERHHIRPDQQVQLNITDHKFGQGGKGETAYRLGADIIIDDQIRILQDARWYNPEIEYWTCKNPGSGRHGFLSLADHLSEIGINRFIPAAGR